MRDWNQRRDHTGDGRQRQEEDRQDQRKPAGEEPAAVPPNRRYRLASIGLCHANGERIRSETSGARLPTPMRDARVHVRYVVGLRVLDRHVRSPVEVGDDRLAEARILDNTRHRA